MKIQNMLHSGVVGHERPKRLAVLSVLIFLCASYTFFLGIKTLVFEEMINKAHAENTGYDLPNSIFSFGYEVDQVTAGLVMIVTAVCAVIAGLLMMRGRFVGVLLFALVMATYLTDMYLSAAPNIAFDVARQQHPEHIRMVAENPDLRIRKPSSLADAHAVIYALGGISLLLFTLAVTGWKKMHKINESSSIASDDTIS